MEGEALGPAFDSNTIGRPTPRKLVTCWMEQAGLPTVILPEVWDELTRVPRSAPVPPAVVQSWWHVRNLPDGPFAWVELDDDQKMVAADVLNSFTAACFPRTPVDRIATLPDANIVAEAVAIGAEALVTGDINTIREEHEDALGSLTSPWEALAGFLTGLDIKDVSVSAAGLKASLKSDPTFKERLQETMAGHLGTLVSDVREFCVSRVAALRAHTDDPDRKVVLRQIFAVERNVALVARLEGPVRHRVEERLEELVVFGLHGAILAHSGAELPQWSPEMYDARHVRPTCRWRSRNGLPDRQR